MRQVIGYPKLTGEELREELALTTAALIAGHNELCTILCDREREYYQAYVRSPGNSVAAKEREAEYYVEDLTRQRLELEARLQSLTLRRDLVVTLLHA